MKACIEAIFSHGWSLAECSLDGCRAALQDVVGGQRTSVKMRKQETSVPLS